jgi:hypothetical protein
MLTQAEADALVSMKKRLTDNVEEMHFPFPGSTERIDLKSTMTENHSFLIWNEDVSTISGNYSYDTEA